MFIYKTYYVSTHVSMAIQQQKYTEGLLGPVTSLILMAMISLGAFNVKELDSDKMMAMALEVTLSRRS